MLSTTIPAPPGSVVVIYFPAADDDPEDTRVHHQICAVTIHHDTGATVAHTVTGRAFTVKAGKVWLQWGPPE